MNNAAHSLSRNFCLLSVACAAILAQFASAQTIWNGAGADNNWSTGTNWQGGTPPANATAVQFAGTTRLTPSLDSARTLSSITFNSGAGAFTLGGSSTLTLTGGVTNSSSNLQTFAGPLTLSGSQTWNTSSDVTVSGTFTPGSTALTKSGSGTLTLPSLSSASGFSVALGGGTVALSGSLGSSMTGTISGSSGTLRATGGLAISGGIQVAMNGALTVDTNGNNVTVGFLNAGGQSIAGVSGAPTTFTKTGSGTLTAAGTLVNLNAINVTGGELIGNVTGSNVAVTNATFSTASTSNSGTITLNAGGILKATSAYSTSTGSVNFAAADSAFNTNGFDVTLGQTLTGTGTLNKTGSGILTLSGTVNVSGGIAVSAGGLKLTGAVTTGTLTVDSNLIFDPVSSTFSGTLTGAGTLTKQGTGTLVFAGTNNLTGGTTVTGGLLQIDADASLGSGPFTINGGGLRYGAAFDDLRSFAVGTSGVTLNTNGFNSTYGSVLSGTGTLTKSGAGTLALTGSNTHTGGITVVAGSLQFASLANFGSGNVSLNGGTLQWADSATTDASSRIILGNSGGTIDIGSNNVTFSSAVTGTGAFTKIGTGVLSLSGANSYAGATTINNGTLRLGASDVLPSTAVIVNATSGGTALLDLNGFNDTIGTLTLGGAGGVASSVNNVSTGAGTLTLGGNVTTVATGNATATWTISGALSLGGVDRTFTVADSTGTQNELTASATIGGTGSLIKAGAGTLKLSGQNTYSGTTIINAGLLEFSAVDNFSAGLVTLNGGGLRWASGTVTDVSGRLAAFGAGGANLDTNANNVTLSSPLSGTGNFTKSGTGTLSLTGSNLYSGTTTVAAGALKIQHAAALGTAAGGTTVNSGAALEIEGGITVASEALTLNGTGISTTGALRNSSGSNAFNGAITLGSAASITADAGSGLSLGGAMNISTHGVTIAGAGNVATTGAISGSSSLTKAGTGTLTLSGSSGWSGGLTASAGLVEFTSLANFGSGNVTLNGGGLRWSSGSTVDVSARLAAFGASGGTLDTNGNNVSLATVLSGTGGLTKSGSGTLTLTAANTHSGNTTVSAGTLQIGNGGTTGSVIGNIIVAGGSTLSLSRSDSVVFTNALSGTGAVSKLGSNTLTLTGDSSHTGIFTINGGLLQVGNGGTSGSLSSAVDLVTGATIRFSRSDSSSFVSLISGAGSLVKDTSEVLTLSGANTFTGGTTLSAGTIAVSGNSALGTGSLALNGGSLRAASTASLPNAVALNTDTTIGGTQALTLSGTVTLSGFKALNIANTATTTITGNITETAPSIFIKQGAGELQITGANTYTGGTFIQSGTVRINNSAGSAFGTGAVTVASGATLAGAGSFTGALQLNGTYSPGNSPGTANTGSQTWAGGGAYVWEINNATGVSGTNWDLLNITGSLNITATNASPFAINLTSLTTGNAAGNVINFNSATNYSYTIATASGGITGFGADKFTLNTGSFTNALNGGAWSLSQAGNNLNLNFTASAIPEPSTYAALAGLAALGLALWRRRSR